MSILIKGMEMPKSCDECPLYTCMHNHDNCPLVPVPEHGRLIDKDALEADISASVVFSGREGNAEIIGAKKIINRLHVAPTIIPAEEGE